VGIGLLIVKNKSVEEVLPPRETAPNDRRFKAVLAE
jgi:hypothetical protein